MTGKVFAVVIGLLAFLFLLLMLPSIPNAVESFRTDTLSQEYNVTTTGGVSIAGIGLSNSLWNNDVAYVTGFSSNSSTDSVIADNYTASGRTLNLTGLTAGTTRLLEVSYRTAGLVDNTGADTGITFLPGIAVGMVIIIPLLIVAGVLLGGRL